MSHPTDTHTESAEWLSPRAEQPGVSRYLQILRERIWVTLAILLVTTGAATYYAKTADKVYEADTDMLITPVPRGDPTFSGLNLLRESNDPTREVESASRLVVTRQVAEDVRAKLKLKRSAESLLHDVRAEPVAGSNILAITAKAGSPRLARNLANVFGDVAIINRTRQLRSQLDKKINSLKARIRNLPRERRAGEPTGRGELRQQRTQLETLRAGGDPTMQIVTRASLPRKQVSPRPVLSIVAGIVGGLILGISGAFLWHSLDPRIRREEQLRNLYGLPILARIPRDTKMTRRKEAAPYDLAPATLESYRTLRAALVAFRHGQAGSSSILIAGSSPGEGKTATAVNLAYALALAGNRVIVVEADLRRPSMAGMLGVEPSHGLMSVLLHDVPLREALVEAPKIGSDLKFLFAGDPVTAVEVSLSLPKSQAVLSQAKTMADWVIVDAPPLAEVTDALPIAQHVDDVLLMARIGKTRLSKLAELGELLARHNIRPVGFAVLGVERATRRPYYSGRPLETPARIDASEREGQGVHSTQS